MSASQETLKEKMRVRRRKLEDTTADSSVGDLSPRKPTVPDHTWAAAAEDPLPGRSDKVDRMAADADMEMTEEMKDEVDAVRLQKKLEKKRRKTAEQLEKDLAGKESDDVSEQIKIAKRKTHQKVLDEANRSATEGEETAVETDDNLESLRIPELAEDDGGVMSPSEDTSSRPASQSPRRMLSPDGTIPKGDRRVSKALNLSIRAKLTEKMRVAKDKAKDEAYDEGKTTGRRLAHKRDTVRTTRFDDESAIKQDREAIDALEKSITLRNKWRHAAHETKEEFMPSKEEAYDFFTRVWEPDPEEEKAQKKQNAEEETAVKTAAEEEEGRVDFAPGTSAEAADTAPAAVAADAEPPPEGAEDEIKEEDAEEDKTGDKDPLLDLDAEEDSWRYYHVSRAEYIPHQKQLDDENKIYFYPSILEAPINEKIFEQEEPRFLEEEGFYVGTKPSVANRNVCKMENRLLKEPNKGQKWFGEDGKLIALPDPLKETPDRPPIWEEMIPELETIYKKATMSQLDSRYIQPISDVQSHYQLDVDVNTVCFTHHHLYSREHVLASKLTDQYQLYISRSRKKMADLLTQKLKALKLAASHLQNTVTAAEVERKPPAGLFEHKQRLREYYDEIRQTRQQRDEELLADRTLLKNIIKTWRDIKSLRQFQKCTNTSVKLQITKEASNKEADQAQWDEDLENELLEVKQDEEQRYQEDLRAYKAELDEWKKQKLMKKDAHKRERQRSRRQSQHTDEEELLQSEKDQELLTEDNLPKPEKPQFTKESEMKEKLLAKYTEIRRKPGEPRLFPEVSNGATVTPNNQCPRGEQQRRNDVNKTKLYVRVLFNDKEVARTPTKALGIDFTVHFTQIFNIEILQWPQSVKLEIVETSGLSSTILSEVFTAVPEANVTADNMQLDEVEFSSYERISHSHEGVGSGVAFSFEADRSNMLSLMTTGSLSTGVAWACDEEGNVLVPPSSSQLRQQQTAMKGIDAVAAIGMAGMADMDRLNEWIKRSHLDPNDPSNAELMYLLRPVGSGDAALQAMQLPSHYRLEQLLEEFNLATDEDLEESKRFRMITLREKEEPQFRNKQVPAFDKEIPDEVFLEYEKEKEKQEKIGKLDQGSHRAAVAQFMQKVREQVILRFRIAAHQKVLSDVIFEEAVPNISNIIPSLVKIAEPRRPLKPIRKERKKITAQNLQGVDVKILVNIVRAFDIPVRSEAVQKNVGQGPSRGAPPATGGLQREGTIRNIAGETLVRPFIEVMFQRNVEATSVADGPNPSWNEELQIPFKAPNNDYSTTNLQTVNDVIYINLFDEYVVDVVADDRDRGTSIHRRIEKRWLGSFKVPFSTVYFNSRIDGTFRVKKPPVLLGYTQDTGGTKLDTGFDIGMGSGEHTYLTMFITVEPALVPPEAVREKFDSSEEEQLLIAADKWQLEVEKKFPKREYKTTVVDINGKSVFLSRYFKPLKPPDVLINGQESPESTAEAVARYVAMIPFVSDSVVFPGMCDIWSTCDQFMSMLQGDEEEHAVLLTNYFLHLGKEVWLLLGSAVPEGPTAYVITKEAPKDFQVWNASTGEHYHYRDNYCPVQSVGCLVNQHNIWANIQPYDQPSQLSFDLTNTSLWKPFFGKSYPHPGFPSVQPDHLLYVTTSKGDVIQIQEKIERTLKEKIMDWRPRNITRWNRYCVSAFRKLLEKLEHKQGRGVQEEHSNELEQILGSYKLCGFPINMPYTELEPIVDSVYATGVHNNETNDVEFAVAVHVHPYPHNVLSVWVYVASLVRKR